MDSNQDEGNERKDQNVRHVEAKQSVFADDMSAEEQETYLVTDNGHGRNDVGANRNCPKGELIPRQKITGVAEKKRDEQENDADDPVKFMGRFVTAAIKNMKHVREDHEDHQVRGKAVKIAKEDAVRNDELEILHVAIGVRRGGMVIEHQEDAGHEENQKEQERNRAEIIRRADMQRLFADFDRHPVKKEISEDGYAAGAIRIRGAAAKHGLPHFGFAQRFEKQ